MFSLHGIADNSEYLLLFANKFEMILKFL